MRWVIWAVMIVLLNVAVTWLARARSSASLSYHAWAALMANTLWIINQLFLVDTVIRGSSLWAMAGVVGFYVVFATASSVLTHRVLLSLEKGAMRVGANHRLHRDRVEEAHRDGAGQDHPRRAATRI